MIHRTIAGLEHRRRTRLLSFAAWVLVGCLLSASSGAKDKKLHVGDIPPDSLGRTAAGDPVKLTDYRGKVVIVAFFASWCAPCRKELPILASVHRRPMSRWPYSRWIGRKAPRNTL